MTPGSPVPELPRSHLGADSGIRIGTAGWSIPRTLADSFPGAGAHLERYARTLPCAEINATFYRSPRPSTYARWVASVPESFRFSLKAPRAISHEAALICAPEQIQSFLDEARALRPCLGPMLFQLPPKLAFDPPRAQTFFRELRALYPGPVALEPRHPTWFSPEADSLLVKLQISRVATDPVITPAAAQPGGYLGLLYFRLHGSPRTYYSSYTPEYLADLAANLRSSAPNLGSRTRVSSAPGSPTEIWCIFDNTASGAAAANALTLAELLRAP